LHCSSRPPGRGASAPGTLTPENVTPRPVLHCERGNVSIPVNISEIPVKRFDVNAPEVIEILLTNPRRDPA